MTFYSKQPDVLPKTLPAGTRILSPDEEVWGVFLGEATLDTTYASCPAYGGQYERLGETVRGSVRVCPPEMIGWASVPMPESTESDRPDCASCGNPGGKVGRAGAGYLLEGVHYPLCKICWFTRCPEVNSGIRRRNAAKGSPISGTENAQSLELTKAGAVEARALCSTPACSARGVEATHAVEYSKRLTLCIYCAQREHEGTRLCMPGNPQENAAARERMATMDRTERPRSTATSREMAKPHPWSCDE